MQYVNREITIDFIEKLKFLFSPAPYKIAYGGRGGGKCLRVGTKVIMADGSLRSVENVKNGEYVMGPDSKPRLVSGTTRGFGELFEIKQTSGMTYVVNDAHILSLKKSKSSINEGRYQDYSEITNINVVDASNKSKRWKEHFRGYRAGLITFPKKNVSIEPRFLGLWLGDGSSNSARITSMDSEILAYCESYAEKLNMDFLLYDLPNNKAKTIVIKNKNTGRGHKNYLMSELSTYGILNNKRIPFDYISNDEETRLNVLAGLIDSDGYLHNNCYEITQINTMLAEDIKYLADTLGFRTKIRKKKTKCSNNGVMGITNRLIICGDIYRIPCIVKHKIVKKEDMNKNKDWLLSQITITPIGVGEYAGFTLDGDHLFLLEDGTVTHNTIAFAQASLILGAKKKLRIGCFREIQKSIKESVHETLKTQIEKLDLVDASGKPFYEVKETSIVGANGTEFFFMGLRHNLNSIKSVADIDIAWVEEAAPISKGAWDIFEPTIRRDPPYGPFNQGSEIWVGFNPELDTDETYKRFVLYPPQGAVVVPINYYDNKFFPDILRRQMEAAKIRNYNDYLTVWEGKTRVTLDGAIFAKEIQNAETEGRITRVPYDKSKPVLTFWDLGKRDHTAIWFVQRVGMDFNIIDFYQNTGETIPHYIKVLQDRGYIYGMNYLPHDGVNTNVLTERSAERMLRAAGFRVRVIPRVQRKSISIQAARVIFDQCYFDRDKTVDGLHALRRYKYEVDKETGNYSRDPLHNEDSDAADAFQQIGLMLKTETEDKKPKKVVQTDNVVIDIYKHSESNQSWML